MVCLCLRFFGLDLRLRCLALRLRRFPLPTFGLGAALKSGLLGHFDLVPRQRVRLAHRGRIRLLRLTMLLRHFANLLLGLPRLLLRFLFGLRQFRA